jgi:hypothetical protein
MYIARSIFLCTNSPLLASDDAVTKDLNDTKRQTPPPVSGDYSSQATIDEENCGGLTHNNRNLKPG